MLYWIKKPRTLCASKLKKGIVKMEITAKLKDSEVSATVNYEFGSNLDEMVAKFGADVVFEKAQDALVIDVQSMVRRHLRGTDKVAAKGQDEIQTLVDGWVPGVGVSRKTSVEKAAALITNMSAEQKAALLAQLQADTDAE
jgi:hypothetical protein